MLDFYSKIPGDPGYRANRIEEFDEVQILLQQIEMILFTTRLDVLGAIELGAELEKLIYTLNLSTGVISTSIYNQITYYCPLAKKYKVDVDVRFFRGTERDIAVVDILINNTRKTGLVIS